MNRLHYIFLSLLLPFVLAGCTQEGIYSDVNFNVTLDAENTYYAGEPVTFNFSGNPEFITFYSGEDGHQYQYRDRFEAPEEDVNSMVLTLQIQHRWGNPDPALDIYYTNDFDGLVGNDGAADRATVSAMLQGGMAGWTKIAYDDQGAKQDVFQTVVTEIEGCVTNFCLAFHWHPDNGTNTERMDTYFVNGQLVVTIEGVAEPMTYDLSTLLGTALMMDESVDPYLISSGNGSIRLDTDQDVAFAGGNYSAIGHRCEGWMFSNPMAFNTTNPDECVVVKNLQNYPAPYTYTYSEPGTYQAVFVGRNANYLGSSEEVKQLQITILNKLDE